ncbi:septal ring lytic transglycosylase RlpA family protein [Roseibium limicola]|nr:septal ring lytic transglycosylase RlpA family protein [Roseibium limicola]
MIRATQSITAFARLVKHPADGTMQSSARRPLFGFDLPSTTSVRRGLCLCVAAGVLAGCSATTAPEVASKFSPKKYGVKGSPKMVANGKPVPKGGGRYVVGKKYKIAGKWYYPKLDPDYEKTGLASWYGPTFHGRKTANGEIFDRGALTAAHTTMPLPSYARVTNVANGRSMVVRVNDRGPFHGNRVIDLSERVASMLDTRSHGVAKVKVEYIGPARLDGQDESFLMASYTGPDAVQPGATRPGTMLASITPPAVVAPASSSFTARVPASRPYVGSFDTAAIAAPSADPALAYEASSQTVQVASTNPFVAVTGKPTASNAVPTSAAAYNGPVDLTSGQSSGVLGTLSVPTAATPVSMTGGSAISSYAAGGRINAAYQAIAEMSGDALSFSQLAARN